MKIVILDGAALNPGDLSWDPISSLGKTIRYEGTETEADAITRIGDAEIVVTNKVPINERILEACPGIRLIAVTATGYNIVDCAACAKRGIPVCNVPGYGTASVAQFTIGLLLELCHRIGYHDELVHQGEWVRSPAFCFWRTPQMELDGKTLGIIGFGAIGRATGRIAKALGMKVLAHSRSETEEGRAIGTYVDLDTLLRESDVISLHCPLFPETEGIINSHTIGKMKDGAILLNTARGGLVREVDLFQALSTGKLRAAAVDVVSVEPMQADNPLLQAPNCIITPHMAWSQLEARQRVVQITADNIRTFLEGAPIHVVNSI